MSSPITGGHLINIILAAPIKVPKPGKGKRKKVRKPKKKPKPRKEEPAGRQDSPPVGDQRPADEPMPPLVKLGRPLGEIQEDDMLKLAKMALRSVFNSVFNYVKKKCPKIEEMTVRFAVSVKFNEEKGEFVLVFQNHPVNTENLVVKSSVDIPREQLAKINDMYYKFFPKLLLKVLNDKYSGKKPNPYNKEKGSIYIVDVLVKDSPKAIKPKAVSKKKVAFEEKGMSRGAFLRGGLFKGLSREVRKVLDADEQDGAMQVSQVGDAEEIVVPEEIGRDGQEMPRVGAHMPRRSFVGASALAFLATILYSKFGWAVPRKPKKKGGKGKSGAAKREAARRRAAQKAAAEKAAAEKAAAEKAAAEKAAAEKAAAEKPDAGAAEDASVTGADASVTPKDGEVIKPDAGVTGASEVGTAEPIPQTVDLKQGDVDSLLGEHLKGGLKPKGAANVKGLSGDVVLDGPKKRKPIVPDTGIVKALKKIFGIDAIPHAIGLVVMEVIRVLPRISVGSLRALERQGKSFNSVPFLRKKYMKRGIVLMDILGTGEISARLHIMGTVITLKFKASKENYNKYYLLDPNAQDYSKTLKAAQNGDVMALLRLYVFSHAENEREGEGLVITNQNPEREVMYLTQSGNAESTIRLNTAFIFGLYNILSQEKVLLIKKDGKFKIQYPYLMFDAAIPREKVEAVTDRFKKAGRTVEAAEQACLDFMGRWQSLKEFYTQQEEEEEVDSEEVDVRAHFVNVVQAAINTVLDREFGGSERRPSQEILKPIIVLAEKLKASASGYKKANLHTSDEITQGLMRYYKTLLIPMISVLAYQLMQDKNFAAEVGRITTGKRSVVSSAVIPAIAMGLINKRFIVNGADEFVSKHGLGLDVTKDLGTDFLTYSVIYAATELLRSRIFG